MNTNGRGAMTRSSTPTTSADNRPGAWGQPHTPPRPSLYSRPVPQERGEHTGHYISVSSSNPPPGLYGSSHTAPLEQNPGQSRLYPGGDPYPPTLTTTAPVFPLAVYPYQYPPQLTYPTSFIRRVQAEQQQPLPHARSSYPFPLQQSRSLSPPLTPGLPGHGGGGGYNLPAQLPTRTRSYIDPHRVSPPPVREDRYMTPGGVSGLSQSHAHFNKLDPPTRTVDPYGQSKSGPRFEPPRPLVHQGPSDKYRKHTVKSEAPLPKIRQTELGGPSSGAPSLQHHHSHHPHPYHHPSQQQHQHHQLHSLSYGRSLSLTSTTSTSCITSAQSASQIHHTHVHHSQTAQSHASASASLGGSSTHTTVAAATSSAAAAGSGEQLAASSVSTQPHYPPHFMKGSVIQLANGDLKRVEDLRTEDFVHSADISTDLKIDSSQVVHIEEMQDRGTAILGFSVGPQKIRVTVEATLEHPFFVFGQGWSSCSPEKTHQHYDLQCHKLVVGDICISLTQRQTLTASPSGTHTTASASTPPTITTNGQDPLTSSMQSRGLSASTESSRYHPEVSRARSPQGERRKEAEVSEGDGYTRGSSTTESGHISGNQGHNSASALLSGQQPTQEDSDAQGSSEAERTRVTTETITGDYATRRRGEEDDSADSLGGIHSRKRRWSAPPPEPVSGTEDCGPIDVTDSSSSSSSSGSIHACTPELTRVAPPTTPPQQPPSNPQSDQYTSTGNLPP